jgi:hypothetical protein
MTASAEAGLLLGGLSRNFLDSDDQFFEDTVGSWTASNASTEINIAFRFRDTYHTLQINPTSTASITLTHNPVSVGSEYGSDSITFFFHAYCAAKTTFAVTITGSDGSTDTRTVVANALQWTVIRGPEVEVPVTQGSTSYTASIAISGHLGQAVYFACPVMTNKYAMRGNRFLRYCMQYIPQVFIEKDYEQSFPNFPMLRILDLGTAYAAVGLEQSEAFKYLDIASGYDPDDDSTKSALVEPTVADPRFLAWLGQVVGVKLASSVGGTTPWGNLPTTWTTFINAIDDAGDNDDNTTWEEIETYNPGDSNFVSGRRQQITTARLGHNAGTRDGIISSVETVLTGTKEVDLVIDPIGSPWTIRINTLTAETPSGANSDPQVLEVASESRPLGFVLTHFVV